MTVNPIRKKLTQMMDLKTEGAEETLRNGGGLQI